MFIRLPPNTTLSTMTDFSRDPTPCHGKKAIPSNKALKNSDADIEEIQQKIFENFIIPIENPIFFEKIKEKNNCKLKKSGFSWFSCNTQQINKFYLESDNIFLTGRVNSKHFYNKIQEENRSDEEIIREMTGNIKECLKFQNASILLKDEKKFNVFLKISDFFIFSNKILKSISNLRVYFGPDEKILEPASQFLKEKVLNFRTNDTPVSEDFIEVKHGCRRGYDYGLKKENMIDFLKNMSKNPTKFQFMECFHLTLCSWFELDDEILQKTGDFMGNVNRDPLKSLPLKNFPLKSVPLKSVPLENFPLKSVPLKSVPLKNVPLENFPLKSVPLKSVPLKSLPLKEVSLYFSGAKITDRGTEELFMSMRKVRFTQLKSLAVGFDARNEYIGDQTIKNWIETVLFISQTNYLTNISFCVVSKNISNHGIWCVWEGLQKIVHRIETLTLVFGNDKKLTNYCLKNFKELMEKAKNLKKLTIGLMSSKLDAQGAQEVLCGVTSLPLLDNFQFYYTNKGSRSKNLEESFEAVLGKMKRKIKEKNLQIHLD